LGVRSSFYAVDVIWLENFAAIPLKDLLSLLHSQKSNDAQLIARQIERSSYDVTLTTREVLAKESSFTFKLLLDVFATSGQFNSVRHVSEEHRRWWIGSLLMTIASLYGDASTELGKAVELLQRVLQGYDCGYPLPGTVSLSSAPTFPILTADDADLRVARWDNGEAQYFVKLLNEIPKDTIFGVPTEKVGIAPDTSEAWNTWVWDVVQEFLTLQTVLTESVWVVSFIG
jgi:hypothetical protein